MVDFYKALTTLERIFLVSALLGGGLLAIRLIMMFMGADGGDGDVDVGDMDMDMDMDVDADAGGEGAFRVLSLQSLSGFLLMFGLVGLGISQSGKAGPIVSLLGGGAAGVATMWLLGKLMTSMFRLQSSGTLDMNSAVGKEGKIYLRIKADGTGKVQVVVQGRLSVFDAAAEGGVEVPTGARVEILKVVSGNVMVVRKIQGAGSGPV